MKTKSAREKTAIVEATVGVFVTLVFTGLAIFTIVVSGSTLFGKKEFPIAVVLPDAMGLRRNDAVIARGTTVGTVDNVFFDTDGVHVHAMLNAPVKFFDGYTITVVATSILGGRQLVIEEGDKGKEEVTDVMNLKGIKPSDLMDDATAAVNSLRNFLAGDFLTNLNATGANLAKITERVEKGEGTLGKLLSSDTEMYDNLNGAIGDVREVIDDMREVSPISTFSSFMFGAF